MSTLNSLLEEGRGVKPLEYRIFLFKFSPPASSISWYLVGNAEWRPYLNCRLCFNQVVQVVYLHIVRLVKPWFQRLPQFSRILLFQPHLLITFVSSFYFAFTGSHFSRHRKIISCPQPSIYKVVSVWSFLSWLLYLKNYYKYFMTKTTCLLIWCFFSNCSIW